MIYVDMMGVDLTRLVGSSRENVRDLLMLSHINEESGKGWSIVPLKNSLAMSTVL